MVSGTIMHFKCIANLSEQYDEIRKTTSDGVASFFNLATCKKRWPSPNNSNACRHASPRNQASAWPTASKSVRAPRAAVPRLVSTRKKRAFHPSMRSDFGGLGWSSRMDRTSIAAAVFFGLAATVLWANYLFSKGKRGTVRLATGLKISRLTRRS